MARQVGFINLPDRWTPARIPQWEITWLVIPQIWYLPYLEINLVLLVLVLLWAISVREREGGARDKRVRWVGVGSGVSAWQLRCDPEQLISPSVCSARWRSRSDRAINVTALFLGLRSIISSITPPLVPLPQSGIQMANLRKETQQKCRRKRRSRCLFRNRNIRGKGGADAFGETLKQKCRSSRCLQRNRNVWEGGADTLRETWKQKCRRSRCLQRKFRVVDIYEKGGGRYLLRMRSPRHVCTPLSGLELLVDNDTYVCSTI